MKVRWSQLCAGGCGRLLRVGAHANRLHRSLWCGPCTRAHLDVCTAHDTATRPAAKAPALF